MTADRPDTGAANLAFAGALVDELRARGLAAAYLCPGSRSTPLALAVAACGDLPRAVLVDERVAAFHALGHARASGRPVLLVCTSGTAGANFLPAVAEASQSRVPLVVATADRPPELRAWGAPQTMEQRHLYAGFTRHSEESPCPSEREGELDYARALARRAIAAATGPAPGPVHLNLPFREPLLPASGTPVDARVEPASRVPLRPVAGPPPSPIDGLPGRGVLVFGPDVHDPALAVAAGSAARARGWPVIADPGSGLRAGGGLDDVLVHGADLMLRVPGLAAELRPDLVVRIGAPPTSAAVAGWIATHRGAEVWLVDPADGFRDPQHRATRSLRMTAAEFCIAAAQGGGRGDDAWLAGWQRASGAALAAADRCLGSAPSSFAPHVARTLWSRLPAGASLYVANSMPIREVDGYAGPRADELRVLVNRGVNGIDGLVSSALGAAAAGGGPVVLWCGDIALLHDVGGLLAGRVRAADLTIVVTNDDGGGIFENLAVAQRIPRERFEELFAVPHGLDLAALARGLGWDAVRVDGGDGLAAALDRALAGGRHLIEVPLDRAANTAFHRAVHSAVADALRGGAGR
ncbi:MAG: 2-succinyl-5-enolpyruvyl-6-hydroxy-3-cyclohexene-1-carboxylic-acid synthase [Steroidobacteraceae bacterium]